MVSAAPNTKFAVIDYSLYKLYKNASERECEEMLLSMQQVLPGMSEISRKQKLNVINSFTEESVVQGTLLEAEGVVPVYIYWILKGQVKVHK